MANQTPRRPLRDLVPAAMVAGAAGLVVALVVGGTTTGLTTGMAPGAGSRGDLVADSPETSASGGRDSTDGISVRVRPTPRSAASTMDGLASIVAAPTGPLSVLRDARVATSAIADALVGGMIFDRAVATAPAAAPSPAAVVPAATSAAVASSPALTAAAPVSVASTSKKKATKASPSPAIASGTISRAAPTPTPTPVNVVERSSAATSDPPPTASQDGNPGAADQRRHSGWDRGPGHHR